MGERGVVDRAKFSCHLLLITMQNVVAFSHTVCLCAGVKNNSGTLGVPPLGVGRVADPLDTRPSPMCYNPEFSRSRSNRIGVGIGVPKSFWDVLGPSWDGAWMTPRNTPLPTWVTVPNLVVLHTCIGTIVGITQIRRINGSLAYRISRSLEVIRNDTDRSATYDYRNYGFILHRFRDKRRLRLKFEKFSHPDHLTPR